MDRNIFIILFSVVLITLSIIIFRQCNMAKDGTPPEVTKKEEPVVKKPIKVIEPLEKEPIVEVVDKPKKANKPKPGKITVSQKSPKSSKPYSPSPKAGFNVQSSTGAESDAEVYSVNVGERITFIGTESATQWNWDLGDGTSSTYKQPGHKYQTSGDYTVTLVINNNPQSVKTKMVRVVGGYSSGKIPAPVVYNPEPVYIAPSVPEPKLIIVPDLTTAHDKEMRRLSEAMEEKFRKIAADIGYENKIDMYYKYLSPMVVNERMTIQVDKNGQLDEVEFYTYYNRINIQGGQKIKVKVLDARDGKITALKIIEN